MKATTTIKEGDFVRIGHQILFVESLDDFTFFGSDQDGDEREYQISQIDQIV